MVNDAISSELGDAETYDFIVAGAGTAGCIVANVLSEDPRNRVLLLEAGGKDDWIWFHIPVGYLFAIGNPRSDWMFQTAPEAGLNGRSLAYPRGKVLGGSSAINAMIAMRGQEQDYDGWRQLGLEGWGWSDVKPVFKELEDHFLGPSDHHGAGGGFRVEPPRVSWSILNRIADAAEQMGIPRTDDFNTGSNEGIGYFHVTQKNGRRWSAARGFLKPAKSRRNLDIVTQADVEQVILDGKTARGLRYRTDGRSVVVKARRDTLLCAGAIGSVQILQRSGIGPADWLMDAGVEVRHALDGVGRNLQDHLQQRAIYKVHNTTTLNETYHSVFGRLKMGLDYALFRRGPLTMAPSQLGIFTQSSAHFDRPNIEFHIQPLSLDKFGEPLHRFPAITASACNLRPSSRGLVRILEADIDSKPQIAPNYLSTDEDRQVACDIIRVTRRLMAQQALADHRPEEYLPGSAVGDDEESLTRAAGDIGTTIFHPVGTAKMGLSSDPTAVVDDKLRVHGLSKLRVIDASVMPAITSGNTNIPTAMIAMKGAGMVLAEGR
jgi:choline dehydrogenase